MRILFIIILGLFSLTSCTDTHEPDPKLVLILNSYHKGNDWASNTVKGVKSIINERIDNVNFDVYYMDTQRFPDDVALPTTEKELRGKYKGKQQPTIIVANDNAAFDFLQQFGDEIFPNVPIVFSGVDGFKPEMIKNKPHITGVDEDFPFDNTPRLMLSLQPKLKQVILVFGTELTATFHLIKATQEVVPFLAKNDVKVSVWHNWTFLELAMNLQNLTNVNDVAVIMYTLHRDREGKALESFEVQKEFARKFLPSNVPVYANWKSDLPIAVGGFVIDEVAYGRQAGGIAVRILKGTSPSAIPVQKPTIRPILRKEALEQFNISPEKLPWNSEIISVDG